MRHFEATFISAPTYLKDNVLQEAQQYIQNEEELFEHYTMFSKLPFFDVIWILYSLVTGKIKYIIPII